MIVIYVERLPQNTTIARWNQRCN